MSGPSCSPANKVGEYLSDNTVESEATFQLLPEHNGQTLYFADLINGGDLCSNFGLRVRVVVEACTAPSIPAPPLCDTRANTNTIIQDTPQMSFLVYATCNPEATKDMSVCELGCEGEYDLAIDAYFDKLEQCNEEYAAYFQVQGRFAVVVGVLMGSSFTNRVRALKEDHPEVDTLILLQVPGSIGDDANIVGYKLVHDYGYKTCIPDVGYGGVASGGTDLLLAGVERYVAEPVVGSFSASGTSIGIHAWSGSGVPDANTLSRTDSRHNQNSLVLGDLVTWGPNVLHSRKRNGYQVPLHAQL